MSNYDELVKFRNRLVNEDTTIYEEDCQLLDRVLDDCEKKDQRIAELEKELADLKEKEIVPKFKMGQEVWHYNSVGYIYFGIILKTKIINSKKIQYSIKGTDNQLHTKNENDLFATLAEAEAKLKELNK